MNEDTFKVVHTIDFVYIMFFQSWILFDHSYILYPTPPVSLRRPLLASAWNYEKWQQKVLHIKNPHAGALLGLRQKHRLFKKLNEETDALVLLCTCISHLHFLFTSPTYSGSIDEKNYISRKASLRTCIYSWILLVYCASRQIECSIFYKWIHIFAFGQCVLAFVFSASS